MYTHHFTFCQNLAFFEKPVADLRICEYLVLKKPRELINHVRGQCIKMLNRLRHYTLFL